MLENQNRLADLFGQKLKKKIFMNKIKVEIVADSINQQGDRLTSLVLTYPRIIHAEMLTHRMLSRNASSSRAVPVQKMIEAVKNNTFCPFEFQKAHKGMQGSEYFTGQDREDCVKLWLESAELALQQAEKMKEKGITKQIINRILEPYQYYTVLITGSKEGWDNFFELRCPQYELGLGKENIYFKSKKEYQEYLKLNGFTYTVPEENWKILNKGQAEIHIMDLAEKIYDVMNESTPKQLEPGEWHIPFKDKLDTELSKWEFLPNIHELWGKDMSLYLVKVSTAMAARTSYTVVGDEKEIDYEKMIELHDKLIEMRHDSPLEHCARAMSDEEYNSFLKGSFWDEYVYRPYEVPEINLDNSDKSKLGWCYNIKGFISYRYIVDKYHR